MIKYIKGGKRTKLERLRNSLFRKAIEVASKKGNEVQQKGVEGLIALTARSAGEYDDLTSGRRDPGRHGHHSLADLLQSTSDGEAELRRMIAEMEGRG